MEERYEKLTWKSTTRTFSFDVCQFVTLCFVEFLALVSSVYEIFFVITLFYVDINTVNKPREKKS